MITKLDERIRLLEMEVKDLVNKMNVIYQSEKIGSYGQVVLLDNRRWTIITSLPVYKTFELLEWNQYSVSTFEFPKKKWNKSEISTNSNDPTTMGTMFNGRIEMFLDSNGYVNIKMSRSGNNINTFISTLVT